MICSCRIALHGFVQIFQVLLEASEISGDAPPEIFLLGADIRRAQSQYRSSVA
jgi:hypothetical protein